MEDNFFCLRLALLWITLVWKGTLLRKMLFFSLSGDHPRFSSLHLKENLPTVNITIYSWHIILRTNWDICFKYDNCIGKLSLMPTCAIILTTLRKFKIHYPFMFIVIIKFLLLFHLFEPHFPYKNLVIAQVGEATFIIISFCLIIF